VKKYAVHASDWLEEYDTLAAAIRAWSCSPGAAIYVRLEAAEIEERSAFLEGISKMRTAKVHGEEAPDAQ
jgi:hypothetical protein